MDTIKPVFASEKRTHLTGRTTTVRGAKDDLVDRPAYDAYVIRHGSGEETGELMSPTDWAKKNR